MKEIIPAKIIESKIILIRGRRVILDRDLALLYGVETKVLNQAVKRKIKRFPEDFMFQLNRQEVAGLSRSQIVTLKRGHNIKYLPYAFTEHGAIMAANILNSRRAVQMSVFVVRAFVKMRRQMLSRSAMEHRLLEIEKILLEHHESTRDLYKKLAPLLLPFPEKPKKQIGFTAKEKRAKYVVAGK